MISVAEAEARILEGAAPRGTESVPLSQALNRALASDVIARRTHPPHDVSAMDGYAIRAADAAVLPARLPIAFEIAAGAMPARALQAGEAARIFTGAVMPQGADCVVLQENTAADGGYVTIHEGVEHGRHIRRAGYDFSQGSVLLSSGSCLSPAMLSLLAAARVDAVEVWKRPVVALLATGNELVPPGTDPQGAQIIASTGVALNAWLRAWGAEVRDLGIARDTLEDIRAKAAMAADADILVTMGGASVGDHDLVQPALAPMGLTLDFWKIAMRPGKPLIFGRMGETRLLGLPGNPVSGLVCALLFLQPLVRAMGGAPWRGHTMRQMALATPLKANDLRQDYIRANITAVGTVQPMPTQDSGHLSAFARAEVLIIRPPHAPAADQGALVDVLML